jgi:hypothetical protein
MFRATQDFVEFCDDADDHLYYRDQLTNFVADCEKIGLPVFEIGQDINVFFYTRDFEYQIQNLNQVALDQEVKGLILIYLARIPEFIHAKEEREKPAEPTLEEFKARGSSIAYSRCVLARANVSKTSDPSKAASWAVYRELATQHKMGILSNENKLALENEVALRGVEGETFESFIDLILSNSQKFISAMTVINGVEKSSMREIDNATNKIEIDLALEKLETLLKPYL